MIGQMAVRVTADRANFPLGTLFIRAGSAANVALMGVPVRPGVDVESITVRVENVDGTTTDFAARQYGGVWVVDLPASHFATVGSVANGVTVFATGTGADGETPRTWNIGIGNLEVLPSDADAPAPTPGATFWPLRMFDAAPTAPTKYNAYLDDTALKIWNGTAWVTISGGGSGSVSWNDVTGKPATFPPSSHTHPQSEVNGLAATLAGKADAADLRYRIAEAAVRKTLPADCFPVTFTYEGVSYSVNSLVKEGEASAAGDMFIMVDETGCYLMMVVSPATVSEKANVIDVATFSAGGVFETSDLQDLQFGGVSPVADTSPTLADIKVLADRTVNLITATDETSIDIELPALANVGRMRDFYVRLTVSATSASTWTIGQGESWDAMGAPPASFAAGTYLYRITEVAQSVFHAEDMMALVGLEAALAAINGGVAP